MIILLELVGLAALALVVLILFRAAGARPDQRDLTWVAWGGLVAWIVFALILLVDFGAIADNPLGTLTNLLIAAIILAAVMGYRSVLGRLRMAADRRGDPPTR